MWEVSLTNEHGQPGGRGLKPTWDPGQVLLLPKNKTDSKLCLGEISKKKKKKKKKNLCRTVFVCFCLFVVAAAVVVVFFLFAKRFLYWSYFTIERFGRMLTNGKHDLAEVSFSFVSRENTKHISQAR